MTAVKSVLEVLSKLSADEKATIRTYLGTFSQKAGRSIKLFDHLVNFKAGVDNEEKIEESVYKTSNPVAFSRLVLRLRDKILEALIIDVNIDREGAYPELTRINIQLRKNITQAQILLGHGLRELAESIFEKVIDQCEKYEFYDELLLALRFLIRQKTLDLNNGKELKTLLRKYEKFEKFKNAVLHSELNYHKVISNTEFHSESSLKAEWLRGILDELSTDFKKTRSIQIGYFYFYIEAEFYQVQRNYKGARKSLLNITRLLESSVVMNKPSIMAGVLFNLANNDLYLTQFDRCYSTADKSLVFLKVSSFNHEQALELMFYAKYYEGDYKVATNIIFQLLPEFQPASSFRKGKRNFLLASCYFMQEDFTTALRYLRLINPIETDKSGWNIGMKLLLLMALIELKEFDEVSVKVENFRRFVVAEGMQNHRAKMISSILQTLIYSGYDFKATYKSEKGSLEMLEMNSGALAWQIKSSEMAIFPQWFFAKVSRQKFIQTVPSSQLIENKKESIVKQE